ncbi:hypothetical protein PoMZ_02427, partial [Pyricularia oryzae]
HLSAYRVQVGARNLSASSRPKALLWKPGRFCGCCSALLCLLLGSGRVAPNGWGLESAK